MPDFLIYSEDKPESEALRQSARADHLGWLKAPAQVKLLSAGPWLDDAGIMRGSLVIVEAKSLKTVSDWLENDPYKAVGLTASTTVKPYLWVIGRPA